MKSGNWKQAPGNANTDSSDTSCSISARSVAKAGKQDISIPTCAPRRTVRDKRDRDREREREVTLSS